MLRRQMWKVRSVVKTWNPLLTSYTEGMRVGVDRTNYKIKMPLPPKIDPSVTMMQVEEKPDVTYDDIGGCKEQIDKLREVVEMPLLNVSHKDRPPSG